MNSISEKIQLLGTYTNIPKELTLKSMPTASELEMVGAEDFDKVMLDTILPQSIEESIDCRKLLEIDYQWICRCLRILNYGPYYTTNAIFCGSCGSSSSGEYTVDLRMIDCKPLPEDFNNDIVISKSEFLDFKSDIHLKLPTIQDILNAYKDKAFQTADGRINRELARICYMISAIGGRKTLTPLEIKMVIEDELSPADYSVLKSMISQLADYGLRAGGSCQCPKCKSNAGAFLALVDDKFFRPTLGDLRRWRDARSTGEDEDSAGTSTTTV